jgi:four helix bundle protein
MDPVKSKFKNEFKKRIYNWVLSLIKFMDKLPKDSVSQVMGRQLLRSGTSVLANYIEANSASSKKDFINFSAHSLKSANESRVWI